MASKKPFLMGIGGGSGSGKSTIVQELKENIGPEKISVINYDAYYRNRPELTFEEWHWKTGNMLLNLIQQMMG